MGGTNKPPVTLVRIETTWVEDIRNWMLQTIGVAAAVIFGAWTVLAWELTNQANVLALAAVCAQLPSDNTSALALLCDAANSELQASVAAIAVSMFGSTGADSGPATATPLYTTTYTTIYTEHLGETTTATFTTTGTLGNTDVTSVPSSTSIVYGGIASGNGPSIGAIVGIVVGIILLLSAAFFAMTVVRLRRTQRGQWSISVESSPGIAGDSRD